MGGMRAAGEATRERILAAAKKEFARHGLAGARISRIAADANASKERLYAYFSSKEALFATVVGQLLSDVTAEAVLRGDDLPGYAGRLFDIYLEYPDNARLADWLDLETADDSAGVGDQAKILQPKIDEIRRGQRTGHIDPAWDPVDLFLLIFEITKLMALPNPVLRKLRQVNGQSGTASARQAAIEAVQRLIKPTATMASERIVMTTAEETAAVGGAIEEPDAVRPGEDGRADTADEGVGGQLAERARKG
jgi:AcrR family transcriptional regulator